jgi:hypothetical protein
VTAEHAHPGGSPASFDDLALPRTELVATTDAWVRSIEPPYLYNHSVRAYVFGRALGQAGGLTPGEDYDDELLFLGCVLHDVGLTEPGDRDQRFEVDGADLAVRFLLGNGVSPERAEVVWDAIALHTSLGIANRKRPEIALMQAGTAADVMGGPADLPPGLADRTLDALPRLGLQNRLRDAITAQAAVNPAKAPPYTLAGELVRTHVPAARVAHWDDMAAASGWEE